MSLKKKIKISFFLAVVIVITPLLIALYSPDVSKTIVRLNDLINEASDFASKLADRKPTAREIDFIIEKASALNGVDPKLVKAVIKVESDFDPNATSHKGAVGLMQLMPGTARDVNVKDPTDPEENISGGAKYLAWLLDQFQGDITLALAAYNAGPKKVKKYGGVPPYKETRDFVAKVLKYYQAYQTDPS